jgi:hypothetical protein
MLLGIETQMPLHTAMAQSTGGHHLGVEQGVAREQAVEKAAMPISPVHHRGHRQAPRVQRSIDKRIFFHEWRNLGHFGPQEPTKGMQGQDKQHIGNIVAATQ